MSGVFRGYGDDLSYMVTYSLTAPHEAEPYRCNTVVVEGADETSAQRSAVEWCYSNDPYLHSCSAPTITLLHIEEA